MQTFLRYLFLTLFGLFCFAYPFAVIGVAFDVKAPFSLAWAGSMMLFVEGTLLVVSAMLLYNCWRALLAGLCVILFSYIVEALGVTTAFPFGSYRYTGILFPALPAGVPLAVMFAWILVVFGSYLQYPQMDHRKREILVQPSTPLNGNYSPNSIPTGSSRNAPRNIGDILLAATLTTLLDLAIEPVAAYIEHYWQWLKPGPLNYYGVPLTNFVSWFAVAFALLLLVNWLCCGGSTSRVRQHDEIERKYKQNMGGIWRLIALAPRILFSCSLFMFGLIDLTHGYYWATVFALLAAIIILYMYCVATTSYV
jgi:putative membrane protein